MTYRDDDDSFCAALLPGELRHIIATFRTIDSYAGKTGQINRRHVSDSIFDVEWALLRLFDHAFAGLLAERMGFATLPQMFHMAAHIYLAVGLRQIHRKMALVKRFVEPLTAKLSLYRARKSRTDDSAAMTLLLWIEIVHYLANHQPIAHTDALKAIANLLQAMNINDLAGLKRALGRVTWASNVLDGELFALWITVDKNSGSND